MTGDGGGPPRDTTGLRGAVRARPESRFDKVAAIRKAIESGTYVVDAEKVAQKMIDRIR